MALLKQIANSLRLREIEALFENASLLSVPRKNAAGNAIEYVLPSGVLNSASIPNLPLSSHTGTGAETTIHSFTLPANTLSAPGHHMEIQMFVTAGGVGNKNWRIRLGGLGGDQIQAISSPATSNRYLRRIDYRNPTTLFTNAITNVSPDLSNPGTPVSIACDWTIDQIFTITATLANSAETTALQSFWVRIFR